MRLLFKIFLLSIVSAVFISCGGGGGGAAPQPVPGTLQFSASDYTIDEDGSGSAVITVTRSGGDDGAVGVSYTSEDGSANAGIDYTAVSGSLSWADGDSAAKTFMVPITNDNDIEAPQTVKLALSNPTGGASLGTKNATLTIISEDAHGELQFDTTSYNVNETDGVVSNVITLQRVNGSVGVVSVQVSVQGGSATGGGTDYTFNTTTVTWPDGNTADKTVPITIVDDGINQGFLTVELSLGNVAGGAVIGTPALATVYIADDEAPVSSGQLQFDSAAYTVNEDGVSAIITVLRVNGTDGPASVDYASIDGTANAGSDYSATSGTLTWADAEGGAKTFAVPITDDSEVEADETIDLSLGGATGASLGTPNTATLTIKYDDTNLTMTIGDGSFWVAFQDGATGDWKKWDPSGSNVYDFPVTDGNGRYGVAFHRQETDGNNTVQKTYVIHATLSELASLNVFRNSPYTVSGTLGGYTGSNDSARVFMQVNEAGGDSFNGAYSIPRVPDSNRDLVAYEYLAASGDADRFVIRRDINITGDLSGQDVDFTSDSDVEVSTSTPHDFSGGANGQLVEVYYATANGTVIDLLSEIYNGTAFEYSYLTNTSLQQLGDAYSFQVSSDTDHKYRIRNFAAGTDPGNRSLGLANLVALTGTSVSASQTTGLSYTPDPNSLNNDPVLRGFQIDLDQSVSNNAHWQIKISTGWLGGADTYAHPDLAIITGFELGWDMVGGAITNTTVSTATTQGGRGGLSLVLRKTMGLNSKSLQPDAWTIAKKLSHDDRLRLDIARQSDTINW